MINKDSFLEMCQLRLNYEKETGVFTWKTTAGGVWPGSRTGQVCRWGYMRITLMRKKYLAHRLAWLMSYGVWPAGQIDHIDGDKLNNAISNLRDVTPSINQLSNNKPRKGNKTGFVGVSMSRDKFKAALTVNGEYRYIGEFPSAESASFAYQLAKEKVLSANHGITQADNPEDDEPEDLYALALKADNWGQP